MKIIKSILLAAVLLVAPFVAHAQSNFQPLSSKCRSDLFIGYPCPEETRTPDYDALLHPPAQSTPRISEEDQAIISGVDKCRTMEQWTGQVYRAAKAGIPLERTMDTVHKVVNKPDVPEYLRGWYIAATKAAYVRFKSGVPESQARTKMLMDCRAAG
ncbi:hypothetical protein V4C53_30195 [Paraburkholderia azotifigens]|uniref:hypothetical protein n=1 Tax=Paraburkholderia azotifigens TaxID=2057004 RepID=UPI003175F508